MTLLRCPVCEDRLENSYKVLRCGNGHSFDIAKEGYVNLLRAGRDGKLIGDNPLSCRSRRDFLNRGYYAPLRDRLKDIFSDRRGSLLDICCGEGYYTSGLGENPNLDIYGFDISKETVRLAAKRGNGIYFVANMTRLPLPDGCFDYATHLFAPFCAPEFARVMKKDGLLYTVIPGAKHLWGLKSLLYDTPYENPEKLPETEEFETVGREELTFDTVFESADDINAVFRMTPYFFHTSRSDKAKLDGIDRLETRVSFIIGALRKK